MSVMNDIMLWMAAGLAFLALSIVWVAIVASSAASIFRFIKEYKKASAELDAEEKEEGKDDRLLF